MEVKNRDKVLAALERNKGEFVSGGKIAEELGITRNGVWRAVNALSAQGYDIKSVRGKGYRLDPFQSVLSAASIEHYLTNPQVKLEFHERIDSTNTRAKALAEAGAPEGTLVVADEQTAGRGRQGRAFFSPPDTGVYFSLVLRPDFPIEDIALVTTYAAVVCAQAIDEIFGAHTQIKWVNDLFVKDRKVSGILTEASVNAESGSVSYVVVGIGINVFPPETEFPASARVVAAAISQLAEDNSDLRARLVATVANKFMEDYRRIPERPHLEEYRKRSLLDGRTVDVVQGKESFRAKVIGVNDDFTLHVRLADGSLRDLVYGEVHIPSTQLGDSLSEPPSSRASTRP